MVLFCPYCNSSVCWHWWFLFLQVLILKGEVQAENKWFVVFFFNFNILYLPDFDVVFLCSIIEHLVINVNEEESWGTILLLLICKCGTLWVCFFFFKLFLKYLILKMSHWRCDDLAGKAPTTMVGTTQNVVFQSFTYVSSTKRLLIYIASIEIQPQELLCNLLLNSICNLLLNSTFHTPIMKGVWFVLLPIHHSSDTCCLSHFLNLS